ncbi:MAG TPA: RsmB/NOP family class I SAM-dependent RNA methyltransferase, partial [Saprospiraceae bacterium]|nr:RsmB/NOP family class I SAM-dependent RNA methyltransferase [Saprospiraceae bacterium]
MHPDFRIQMQAQLGAAFADFADALTQPAPVSIRANRHKWTGPAQHDGQVPWCKNGYYLAERPPFTLDPLLHAGAYYVQEASSMSIAHALRQLVDLENPLLALDLAAAPGGKSTLLAGMLSADSLLIANEVIRNRYQALRHNLARWGLPNVAVSQHDPEDFAPLAGSFDLVLVDAPCSGEGLFRKDPDAQKEWSPAQVGFCAARQRRILAQAAALMAPGGVLVYSTCTYNDEENAANAAWLQEVAGLEYAPVNWPSEWGVEERRWGYQFYPHRVRGEGFYVACFRRVGGGRLAVGGGRAVARGGRWAVGSGREVLERVRKACGLGASR